MMTILLGAIFGLLLLTGASLTALAEFSRSRLEKYCEARDIRRLGLILDHDDDAALALRAWHRLLLLALVIVAFYASWTSDDRDAFKPSSWIAELGVLWLALWLSEVLLARPVGRSFAEPILFWFWPILNALRLSASPIVELSHFVSQALGKSAGRRSEETGNSLQDEILTVVNEGEREGEILGEAADMIAGLMELHEVEVSEIMTPRTDIIMIPIHTTIGEARVAVDESGHSRIPVYRSNRDEVVGFLYAKDLLPHLGEKQDASKTLADILLRDPVYVSRNKRVDVLLREFRHQRVHIAIVLDEFGGVAGLVTIEDIIEEIIGDIQDEYDEEPDLPLKVIDGTTAEVDGRVEIETLNETLFLDLPLEDADTIGGFVFSMLGRIPNTGESFVHQNARFTILDATDRSIQRLRIERIDPAQAASSA